MEIICLLCPLEWTQRLNKGETLVFPIHGENPIYCSVYFTDAEQY
jgi:hypothetical protein